MIDLEEARSVMRASDQRALNSFVVGLVLGHVCGVLGAWLIL